MAPQGQSWWKCKDHHDSRYSVNIELEGLKSCVSNKQQAEVMGHLSIHNLFIHNILLFFYVKLEKLVQRNSGFKQSRTQPFGIYLKCKISPVCSHCPFDH